MTTTLIIILVLAYVLARSIGGVWGAISTYREIVGAWTPGPPSPSLPMAAAGGVVATVTTRPEDGVSDRRRAIVRAMAMATSAELRKPPVPLTLEEEIQQGLLLVEDEPEAAGEPNPADLNEALLQMEASLASTPEVVLVAEDLDEDPV